jgi:beta-lactamase regulating signal transducer with metallopeptidase domain/DUF4097 and DUF4098 domain-containing protein YvlB
MSALLNGLWQGMLLTVVVWAAMKAVPGLNAATRHVLWWITLAAVLMLPFAGTPGGPSDPALSAPSHTVMTPPEIVILPPMPDSPVMPEPTAVGAGSAGLAETSHKPWEAMQISAAPVRWLVGGIWLVLSATLGIRLARSFRWMQQLRARTSEAPALLQARMRELQRQAGFRRYAALGVSADLTAPLVLGLQSPMIVLPAALAQQISEEDFDHVALHELVHLARYDDWTNLLQRVVEVLLPIQPAVLLITRQIGLEREAACDDRVVGLRGEAKSYAAALTRVAELTMWARSGLLASGAIGRPSQLYQRVARLVGRRRYVAPRVSYAWLGLGIPAVALLVLLALHVPQVIAVADPAPETTLPATKPEDFGAGTWKGAREFEQARSFAVRAGEKLLVDVDRGNVHITGADQATADIVVKYTGRTNAELKQFLDHHTTTMTQDPGIVRLTAKGDAWLSTASVQVQIEYEIRVPATFDASAKTGAGNMEVSGLAGKLDADTGMGKVTLNQVTGPTTARSGAGNVEVSGLDGKLDVNTGTGNITLTKATGPTTAHTGAGNVNATGLAGNLDVNTGMGKVTLTQVTGPTTARSGAGSVEVSGLDGKLDVNTGTGNITLTKATGPTTAHTGAGNVNASGMDGKLDVDTGMGNVSLTKTTGPTIAHTGAGNVDSKQSAGTLTVTVGQGNVVVAQFGGDWVKAETKAGNVTADLPLGPKGDCSLLTAMGNVSLKLAGKASVNLHASTAMGRMDSQFAEGANNGGGPVVRVETKAGNVHVEKE